MASVDWKKIKTRQEVFAILRHNCKDTRLKTKTHNNKELNKDLTILNTGIIDGYEYTKTKYNNRMNELPPPRRKDAVIGLGFTIPFPKDLQRKDYELWTENVYKLMSDNYGKDNICCFVTHRDEVHEYIDVDTKKKTVSRPHIHGVLVPEINGKLNARDVTARNRMININNVINDMTEETFGISWLTGAKSKSKGSVEDMKYKSHKLELQEQLDILKQENQDLNLKNVLLKNQNIKLEVNSKAYSGFIGKFDLFFKVRKEKMDKLDEDVEALRKEYNEMLEQKQQAINDEHQAINNKNMLLQEIEKLKEEKLKKQKEFEEMNKQKLEMQRELESVKSNVEEYIKTGGNANVRVKDIIINYLTLTGQYNEIYNKAMKDVKTVMETSFKQHTTYKPSYVRKNNNKKDDYDLSL